MRREVSPEPREFDCRIILLGGFRVCLNNTYVRVPSDAIKLLAFLALRSERVPRSFVAGSLWAERDEERAFGNLRSALWRLRSVSDLLVESDQQALAITSLVKVDLWDAIASARLLETRSDDESKLPPLDMFTSELLPGWYDEWVLVDRERHRQRSLHALEQLSVWLLERERYGAAIQAALAAVAQDPFRESSQRLLISIHLREGNYSEARRQYEQYRQLLYDELAVAPSPLLQRLIDEATGGAMALAD
jgi:DNA-binding SARP family transcriptional activator